MLSQHKLSCEGSLPRPGETNTPEQFEALQEVMRFNSALKYKLGNLAVQIDEQGSFIESRQSTCETIRNGASTYKSSVLSEARLPEEPHEHKAGLTSAFFYNASRPTEPLSARQRGGTPPRPESKTTLQASAEADETLPLSPAFPILQSDNKESVTEARADLAIHKLTFSEEEPSRRGSSSNYDSLVRLSMNSESSLQSESHCGA